MRGIWSCKWVKVNTLLEGRWWLTSWVRFNTKFLSFFIPKGSHWRLRLRTFISPKLTIFLNWTKTWTKKSSYKWRRRFVKCRSSSIKCYSIELQIRSETSRQKHSLSKWKRHCWRSGKRWKPNSSTSLYPRKTSNSTDGRKLQSTTSSRGFFESLRTTIKGATFSWTTGDLSFGFCWIHIQVSSFYKRRPSSKTDTRTRSSKGSSSEWMLMMIKGYHSESSSSLTW